MPGSFCSSSPSRSGPWPGRPRVGAAQTICGSPSLMPKPFRKPSWRSWPTETPGARSSVAIFGVLPFSFALALAYSPISSPALRLSVANSASAASCRLGRRVQRDDHHARVARLLDRRHDRLGVAGVIEDALRALRRHVLDRGDLARRCRRRTCPPAVSSLTLSFLACRLRALLHLHEERVGLGLGDQADRDLLVAARRRHRRRHRCCRRHRTRRRRCPAPRRTRARPPSPTCDRSAFDLPASEPSSSIATWRPSTPDNVFSVQHATGIICCSQVLRSFSLRRSIAAHGGGQDGAARCAPPDDARGRGRRGREPQHRLARHQRRRRRARRSRRPGARGGRAARLPAQPHRQHAAPGGRPVGEHRPDLRGRVEPVLRVGPPRGGGRRAGAPRAHARGQLRRGARAGGRARRGVRRPRRGRPDRRHRGRRQLLPAARARGRRGAGVRRPPSALPRRRRGRGRQRRRRGERGRAPDRGGAPPHRLPRRPVGRLHGCGAAAGVPGDPRSTRPDRGSGLGPPSAVPRGRRV